MRNTQTGLFSGLFVIIGHNLVICTEIWSILQRTAGTLLFLLSWGEKYWDWWTNCQTSKLKLQVHYKHIKSYSKVHVHFALSFCHFYAVTCYCILNVVCILVLFCLLFGQTGQYFSTAQHNITFIFSRYSDILILSQHMTYDTFLLNFGDRFSKTRCN